MTATHKAQGELKGSYCLPMLKFFIHEIPTALHYHVIFGMSVLQVRVLS